MSDVPDFAATCPPGTRIVLLYEQAMADGTWGEKTPPRYGTVIGTPTFQNTTSGPWWTVPVQWDGVAHQGEMALVAWWRQGESLDGDAETGFARVEDELPLRVVVRRRILANVSAQAERLLRQAREADSRWEKLLAHSLEHPVRG